MNFLREHVFAPLFIFLLFVTLFFMIAFVRFIIITAKIRRWRKFAVPAVGVVGKLKDVNCIYDRYGEIFSYRHNFELKIICGDREFESVYSEEVMPDHIPITQPGQRINILWSARDHKYIQSAETPQEERQLIKQLLNDTSRRYLRAHRKLHWTQMHTKR
jgi:hypothetical protein